MAAKKQTPAKKKNASPAGAKKKARGKKPKATERSLGSNNKKNNKNNNAGHAQAAPPVTVAKPAEPEAPVEPPVMPIPSASFTF